MAQSFSVVRVAKNILIMVLAVVVGFIVGSVGFHVGASAQFNIESEDKQKNLKQNKEWAHHDRVPNE